MDRPNEPALLRHERRQGDQEAGRHAIQVTAQRREPLELDRLVAALLALAVAELDAENERSTGDRPRVEQSSPT